MTMLPSDEQAEIDAVFAVPYDGTPSLTRRGVQHTVVHVHGYLADGQFSAALVDARTRCGIDHLLIDRTTVGCFRLCRRCHPESKDTP